MLRLRRPAGFLVSHGQLRLDAAETSTPSVDERNVCV